MVGRRFVVTPVAATGIVLALACGEPAGRVGLPEAPEERFVADLARRVCVSVAGCCRARKLSEIDQPTCEALVRGSLETRRELRRPSGGQLDPRAAAACLAKVEAYAMSCVDPEMPLGFLDTGACDELFRGGRAAGEACRVDAECARVAGARAKCEPKARRCELYRSVTAGEVCEGECDADDCETSKSASKPFLQSVCDERRGLFCDRERKLCASRGAIGARCAKDVPCASDGACRDGACVAKSGPGTSCAKESDICVAEASCDQGSRTCVSKRKNGEACADDAYCSSGNCAGKVCRARSDATMLHIGSGVSLFCSPLD